MKWNPTGTGACVLIATAAYCLGGETALGITALVLALIQIF